MYFRISLLALLASLVLSCSNHASEDPTAIMPANGNSGTAKPDSSKTAPSLDSLLTKYDPPDRVLWQKPELVIQKMGDLENKVVADIGAGSGFFSRRLAQHAKKVIAVEVDPRFIHFMDSIKLVELAPEYQKRFETRLATYDNSKLKPGEADIILVVNTYIYFQNRVQYLRHLLEVLPDDVQLVIVDFKKKRLPISYPPQDIRLELWRVEKELQQAGFNNIVSDDCSLDYQYIVTARKGRQVQ